MDGRQLFVAGVGPGVVGELDGVFVAVHLHALLDAVILILEPGEAAGVAGPHVPFGGTLGHPFGQHFACAAGLADAKGEDASLIGIGLSRHRADQRVAIGGVGDRAVDHLGQAAFGEQRHALHGVVDVPFQTVQVVGEQLEAEILRERVVGGGPMGAAIAFIGAKVEAVLLLPQVIA